MASPSERLAASLAQLAELQKNGRRVFQSDELTRVHRRRLIENGFLQEVVRGWLISSSPGVEPGDTTPWYACFWEFCARYCTDRFGDDWHLSPEQSLLLHAESSIVPPQVVVSTPAGANNTLTLPFATSLYDLRRERMPPPDDLIDRDGLHLYRSEVALTKVSETFFRRHPIEAQVALLAVRDPSEVLGPLLNVGRSTVAGRLAGAFRGIGRDELADDITGAMKAAGYDVREADPFEQKHVVSATGQVAPPIVERLRALWASDRGPILEVFPEAPGRPSNHQTYLQCLDETYGSDAYHSLSIEGYQVSRELVERVRSGLWDPERRDTDRGSRDALAARGYWQAFQLVREAVVEVIGGGDPAATVAASHRDWFRELFQPCVAAGLLEASVLAGYRRGAVYLRGSRHMPPRPEAVRDAMPALFDLFAEETEPSVRAVLGHWFFGYIHPYPDGNGRIARFVMNVMLASGGYPWTVIRVDDRATYLDALEAASVNADIRPFARFLAREVGRTMKDGVRASEG